MLALSNLDLVHRLASSCYTSQWLHYLPICNICVRLVPDVRLYANLHILHSLAGWVLTSVTCHVAASHRCDSDDLYTFVTG